MTMYEVRGEFTNALLNGKTEEGQFAAFASEIALGKVLVAMELGEDEQVEFWLTPDEARKAAKCLVSAAKEAVSVTPMSQQDAETSAGSPDGESQVASQKPGNLQNIHATNSKGS